MKYRWMTFTKKADHNDGERFNALPLEMRRFGIPKTEDDFFIHSRMFDGSKIDLAFRDISYLSHGDAFYFSLNELIGHEAIAGVPLRGEMMKLRKKLFYVLRRDKRRINEKIINKKDKRFL
jgi:hypothetical protein